MPKKRKSTKEKQVRVVELPEHADPAKRKQLAEEVAEERRKQIQSAKKEAELQSTEAGMYKLLKERFGLSKTQAEKILEAVSVGLSLEEAADIVLCEKAVLDMAAQEIPLFGKKLRQARAQYKLMLMRSLRDGIEMSPNLAVKVLSLRLRHADKFDEAQEQEDLLSALVEMYAAGGKNNA